MKEYKPEEDLPYFGVDLHIHTPSSSCYKGPKTDEEYINIVRRYYNNNIKVIAITDHNSIKGYKKLMKIKEELSIKYKVLGGYLDTFEPLKDEYEKIKADLELFKNMLIIPGIEFEANPGIHMLLIFNPKTDLNKLESFLIESGYSEEDQGIENFECEPNLDVLELLDKAYELEAITIAAHADSNKGIYNMPSGQYRSRIFKSEKLDAISYNSHTTCEKIKSLFKNKEYKRESDPAFIQCSDYHGGDQPGSCISYFKLSTLSFEAIKQALKNPNECVSPTEHPKVTHILKKIIGDSRSISIKSMNLENDLDLIKKSACAILNNEQGILVIGAISNPVPTIIGVSESEDECVKIVNKIFKGIQPSFSKKITIFPFGNNHSVISIKLLSYRRCIYYVDDKVFIIENGKVIEAKPRAIEKIVEEKLLKRMIEHEKLSQPKLEGFIKQMDLYKDQIKQVILINKLERCCQKLSDIVSIDFITYYNQEKPLSDFMIGDQDGNVYIVEESSPRLPYAYLRCTCKKTNKHNIEEFDVKKFTGKAIVIAPGGGVYYIDNDNEWCIISVDKRPTLVLQIDKKNEKLYSELGIIGWLKSSLMLWYSSGSLGSVNLHLPEIYSKIPIPNTNLINPGGVIENLVLKICDLENIFLSTNFLTVTQDEYQKLVEIHNSSIELIAMEIDSLLFNEFDLDDNDMNMINNFFEIEGIYNLSDNEYEEQEEEPEAEPEPEAEQEVASGLK